MDAMVLVRRYSRPNIFLTMTCNPSWDEITQNLYYGQSAQDRPDLVVRLFRAMLEELKNPLFKKHILGKVKAHVCMSWSSRGWACPHAYFVLIMAQKYKLTCLE
jgi:hypothetical protein